MRLQAHSCPCNRITSVFIILSLFIPIPPALIKTSIAHKTFLSGKAKAPRGIAQQVLVISFDSSKIKWQFQ